MTVVSVLYPKSTGTFFDLDYYLHKHVVMTKALLTTAGLQSLQLLQGKESATGGEPAQEMIALLTFLTEQDCRAALEQHGTQVLDDIPNFTDMKYVIQFNNVLES